MILAGKNLGEHSGPPVRGHSREPAKMRAPQYDRSMTKITLLRMLDR
jgi:hypothetical protein